MKVRSANKSGIIGPFWCKKKEQIPEKYNETSWIVYRLVEVKVVKCTDDCYERMTIHSGTNNQKLSLLLIDRSHMITKTSHVSVEHKIMSREMSKGLM